MPKGGSPSCIHLPMYIANTSMKKVKAHPSFNVSLMSFIKCVF